MRKNATFGIAAFGFTLAMILFATSLVEPTSADVIRPKAGVPHVAPVASFLPDKLLEPMW